MENELFELNQRAKEDAKKYAKKRFVYLEIQKSIKERSFLGLLGPRGVGKTVILKQLLTEINGSFYISLDSYKIESIYTIAKELSDKGIACLLIDEIHNFRYFEKDLKKIYDFLNIKIVFTSSCALSIYNSEYDLSRRVRTIEIYPFSFREFLYFEGKIVSKFDLADISDTNKCKEYYASTFEYEHLFDNYLKGANYPFSKEEDETTPFLKNIINTIITRDIPIIENISLQEQDEIEKVLKFIGTAPVENISYSSISTNTGITKYKAEKYASYLMKAFLIQIISPRGINVLKEPKVLLSLPYRLVYQKFEDCIGGLREDFFAEACKMSKIQINYLKSTTGEKTPDYLTDSIVFEIGGKNKGREQFKGTKYEQKIILTHPGKIDEIRRPLFFIGMI